MKNGQMNFPSSRHKRFLATDKMSAIWFHERRKKSLDHSEMASKTDKTYKTCFTAISHNVKTALSTDRRRGNTVGQIVRKTGEWTEIW